MRRGLLFLVDDRNLRHVHFGDRFKGLVFLGDLRGIEGERRIIGVDAGGHRPPDGRFGLGDRLLRKLGQKFRARVDLAFVDVGEIELDIAEIDVEIAVAEDIVAFVFSANLGSSCRLDRCRNGFRHVRHEILHDRRCGLGDVFGGD